MRWLNIEYILKGVFLGLLLLAALQGPTWEKTGQVALYMVCGLGAGLLISLVMWIIRGIHVGGRLLSLLMFLILESPTLVYAGLIGGLAAGAWSIHQPDKLSALLICIGLGAAVGVAMDNLRRIASAPWRFTAASAAAVTLVGCALYY